MAANIEKYVRHHRKTVGGEIDKRRSIILRLSMEKWMIFRLVDALNGKRLAYNNCFVPRLLATYESIIFQITLDTTPRRKQRERAALRLDGLGYSRVEQ
jgi:hypothetical protein